MVMEAAADLYADIHGTPAMSRPTYIATLDGRIGKLRANQKLLAKAGEIGTQVHALVEWNIRRHLQQKVGPEPKVEEKALWAFMAWEDWAKSVHLKPMLIEQTVFSLTHGYAGTMDLLAEVGGRVTLLDFKTGKAIYAEAHLQNVAYQAALAEMGHVQAEQGMIVRLPKNEQDPGFETATCPAVADLFPTFLAVKSVWEWWFAQEQAYREKLDQAKQPEPASRVPPTPEPSEIEQTWVRIKELCEAKHISKPTLSGIIKKLYGVAPRDLSLLNVQALLKHLQQQQA
jgi:hypothetical protein